MDLFCCETEVNFESTAGKDGLIDDDRVIKYLMQKEDKYFNPACYFKCMQNQLKPYMRKIVGTWMLEVCEQEGCREVIFPLAMSLLDRFLSVVIINKSQLQLVGTVCLLIASKMRQSRSLSTESLCAYTDNSFSLAELMEWELLVLGKLKWDVCGVTPNDFLDYILRKLPLKDSIIIKRHAETFITLCALDIKFRLYPPSMIAAASIGASIQGLIWLEKNWKSQEELLRHLQEVTAIEGDCLRECMGHIEALIEEYLTDGHGTLSARADSYHKSESSASRQSVTQAETPTDVQDIHF